MSKIELRLRCPHCKKRVMIGEDETRPEITCPECMNLMKLPGGDEIRERADAQRKSETRGEVVTGLGTIATILGDL